VGKQRKVDNEPYWEPLPRQHFAPAQIAFIVVRNLVPFIAVLWVGGSAGQFLMLSMFNALYGATAIATVDAAVSTRQEGGAAAGSEASTFVRALVTGLVISLFLTAMFGWFIALLFAHEVFRLSILWPVLAIVVAAAPPMYRQYQADLRANISEDVRKKRDQPNIMVLIFSAVAIALLCMYAIDLGRYGLIPLMVAVTVFFIVRDLRPDLAREMTRPRNRPPSMD
jgi:hypothetical protein